MGRGWLGLRNGSRQLGWFTGETPSENENERENTRDGGESAESQEGEFGAEVSVFLHGAATAPFPLYFNHPPVSTTPPQPLFALLSSTYRLPIHSHWLSSLCAFPLSASSLTHTLRLCYVKILNKLFIR